MHACSARKPPIRVSNVPTAVDDATADTAVFLIIGALRGFNTSMLAAREGKWRGAPAPPLGHDPEGKVLGILGMGGIGRNMKKKTDVFVSLDGGRVSTLMLIANRCSGRA